jgi:hypothetical protein
MYASPFPHPSDQQDASPGQQRDKVAKLAARHGFHLVGEYYDGAISATGPTSGTASSG